MAKKDINSQRKITKKKDELLEKNTMMIRVGKKDKVEKKDKMPPTNIRSDKKKQKKVQL